MCEGITERKKRDDGQQTADKVVSFMRDPCRHE